MKRFLLVSLVGVFLVLLLLPIGKAQRKGQGPNGPSREASPDLKRDKPSGTRRAVPRRAAARTGVNKFARVPQSSSPAPISVQADSFAVSAPVSEIAAESAAVESDAANAEEQEAAENRAVHEVTAAAMAKAQKMSALQAQKMDQALQTLAPTLNIPSPGLTFEGLGRTENIAAGFGNLSPPDTNGYVEIGRAHV